MVRKILGTVAGLSLVGALLYGFLNRGDLIFWWNLWRASQAGERFYDSYEHLARDVMFDPSFDVRLDVYSPPSGENHPVLIFVHGGGWDKYDKKLFAPVALKLVPQGLVVVIPDYTLYPNAGYAQMASEMAAATAWTFDHIADYGGDPHKVIIAGHSAGGHLAGLVALDPQFLAAYNHTPTELSGFLGLSGVYDVNAQMAFERSKESGAPVMTAVMGGEANFAAASPNAYISAAAPPTRLIHGALDDVVPLSISEAFQAQLRSANVDSELIVYPQAEHTDYFFAGLSDDNAPIIRDIVGFFRDRTGLGEPSP